MSMVVSVETPHLFMSNQPSHYKDNGDKIT